MPRRKLNFENDKFYNISDKGRKNATVFEEKDDFIRALKTLSFYQFDSPGIKLSRLLAMKHDSQSEFVKQLEQKGDRLVEIVCFCFLSGSIDLLLRQKKEGGISLMMSQFLNSYTRYFNSKRKSKGAAFLDSFKAKEIGEELLENISRYIHLRPLNSGSVGEVTELSEYPWNSYWEYTHPGYDSLSKKEFVLSRFAGDSEEYKRFVENLNDYNNTFASIKSLVFK